MKSIQAKSLEDDTKYHNQPYQEEILTSCTKCGTKDSKILGGLCSACLKQKEGKEREQKVDPKKVNYYQLLDVKENASQDEIKKKWKVLAKEFHPDINDSTIAQDEFIIYRKAYEILSDPKRRQEYDRQINRC